MAGNDFSIIMKCVQGVYHLWYKECKVSLLGQKFKPKEKKSRFIDEGGQTI